MTADVLVRSARTVDASLLAVLATQVWLHTYATEGVAASIAEYVQSEMTPQRYAALLQDSLCRILVAERDNHLLGFAVLRLETPCPNAPDATTELQTLYVQEHFIGQGLGARLLQEAEKMAVALTSSRLWLTVNARNESAITFYAKCKYQKVGTTVFVLGGVDHENHVMAGPNA